jgi:hypothetical protein
MAMCPERLMPETVENLHPPSGLNVLVSKVRPEGGWGKELEGLNEW